LDAFQVQGHLKGHQHLLHPSPFYFLPTFTFLYSSLSKKFSLWLCYIASNNHYVYYLSYIPHYHYAKKWRHIQIIKFSRLINWGFVLIWNTNLSLCAQTS
jgi:hypothetical protein